MSEKRTHFGMAGHYVAMSEFLRRGWNVATSAVDVGDDIYVVNDGIGTLRRVQVKARRALRDDRTRQWPAVHFNVSRKQLRELKETPLYYMFMLLQDDRWRYLLIAQTVLQDQRKAFESRTGGRPGPSPRTDDTAQGDDLGPSILFGGDTATFWGVVLPLDTWHPDFPELSDGPGARSQSLLRTPGP